MPLAVWSDVTDDLVSVRRMRTGVDRIGNLACQIARPLPVRESAINAEPAPQHLLSQIGRRTHVRTVIAKVTTVVRRLLTIYSVQPVDA